MSMASFTKGAVVALAVILNAGTILGEEPSGERQLVERIVASWRARQKDIRTIRARAAIESFYSKGYVNSKHFDSDYSDYGPIPPEDVWFKDQWQSWDIDFHQGCMRKELDRAEICSVNRSIAKVRPMIRRFYRLEFFLDKNTTEFRRPEDSLWWNKTPSFLHHVSLYGHRGHEFVIECEDLPLFWWAGGTITGDWQNPLQMLKVDEPDRFTFYGRTKYQQRDCLILRVRNQQSTTSVVEFWVDESPPNLIYQRRIVRFRGDAEILEQQMQVDYRDQQGHLVPSTWTISRYSYHDPFDKNDAFANRRLFTEMRVYTVEQIEVNRPLPRKLFTPPPLKVGMGVDDVVKNERYVVDHSGKLVPFRDPEQQRRLLSSSSTWRSMRYIVVLVMTIMLVVAAWFGSKYGRKLTNTCRWLFNW